MKQTTRFAALVVCAFLLSGARMVSGQATTSPSKTDSKQAITVGKNLHISRETSEWMHGQTLAVTNPNNPNELLACSHTIVGDGTKKDISLVYFSRDAGNTWQVITPNIDQEMGTDPTVAFGVDGTMYFAYIAHPPEKLESVVMRSVDRGKSWSATRFDMVDRHFLLVDHTRSPFRGRIYISGRARIPRQRWGGFGLRYSRDGGATFSEVVGIADPDTEFTTAYSPGVVLSDGTLVFLARQSPRPNDGKGGFGAWPAARAGKVFAIRSKDGGETVAAAGVLTNQFADTGVLLASNDFLGLGLDTSDGPFKDRIYAAFSSYDPDTHRRDILTSYSSDQGVTWSILVAVNDDALPADLHDSPKHFMPTVAVNKFGVVGITWHDRRGAANGLDWNVRFAASLDGGQTYGPSVAVSETPFSTDRVKWFPYPGSTGGGTSRKYDPLQRPEMAAQPRAFSYVTLVSSNFTTQHTAGLATDGDGTFHSFWINNRTDVPQLWTAPITVNARAARNGGGELETLADVSTLVAIRYEAARYDRASRILTLDGWMENVSGAAIRGPFYLRVITTQPRMHPLGTPTVLSRTGDYRINNADNGVAGNGAIWRFQSTRSDDVLQAGEKSAMRQLRFEITAPPTFEKAHQLGTYAGGFLTILEFDSKVLASSPPPPSGK